MDKITHTTVKNALRDILFNEMGLNRNETQKLTKELLIESATAEFKRLRSKGVVESVLRDIIRKDDSWTIKNTIREETAKLGRQFVADHITITPITKDLPSVSTSLLRPMVEELHGEIAFLQEHYDDTEEESPNVDTIFIDIYKRMSDILDMLPKS